MIVEIRLFAQLRDENPHGGQAFEVELPPESTGEDLLQYLGITTNNPLIIMVNGSRQLGKTVLRDGDRVGIFPPVGGG